MRVSREKALENREQIIETAARLLRQHGFEGIGVADITPDIASQLDLPANTKGVVVAEVEDGSPAAEAGLMAGDIIKEVDRQPVRNVAEFRSQLAKRGKDPLLLLVSWEGHTVFVAVKPR